MNDLVFRKRVRNTIDNKPASTAAMHRPVINLFCATKKEPARRIPLITPAIRDGLLPALRYPIKPPTNIRTEYARIKIIGKGMGSHYFRAAGVGKDFQTFLEHGRKSEQKRRNTERTKPEHGNTRNGTESVRTTPCR